MVLERTSYSDPADLFGTVTGHLTDAVTANGGANFTAALAATTAALMASGEVDGVSFLKTASVVASAWVAPTSFVIRKLGDWSKYPVSWYV